MSKFVAGELCEDVFGRPVVFLNYVHEVDCIVYNPRNDTFEVYDSRPLKPVDRYYFHRHVIDVESGINALSEAFDFKIFELHRKALPTAEKHLKLFKSLEGCTIDLSDSKLDIAHVTISDNESHNWEDLIEFIGVRTRDNNRQRYCVPLSVLKPNSALLRGMVSQLQED